MTRVQRSALEMVAWGTKEFGAIVSGRTLRRRTLEALVRMGLVEACGLSLVCDGDGYMLVPERIREGWTLTPAGRAAIKGTKP